MSDEAILIYVGFVSILFMAVGIFGICKKIKFSKSIPAMHRVTGVLVDYDVVQKRDDDNLMVDVYFPIYEYEWGGVKKRLESTTSGSVKAGRKVHILVDPQTEKAICLEDVKRSDIAFPIFGVIGVAAFVLVLLTAAGKL